MKIRIATKDDLETLLEFEQGLIAYERPLDPSIRQTENIHYYDLTALMHSDDSEVFVVEIDDSVVGCGYGTIEENKSKFIEKRYGYIGFVFVKAEYRRRRAGEKIIEHLLEWFKARGAGEAKLRVYEGNTSAIKAYEKIGFRTSLLEMKINL